MGEATRYESPMAQRLLAVGELYARRAREHPDWQSGSVDVTDAVAAEISAVQNISHHRAVAQVGYARTLCERLPAVARVFLRGTIDYRMVSTLISHTGNVDDEVIGTLDAALAARVEKWMKLSKPKLRDRIDTYLAQFDAAGVRIPRLLTSTATSTSNPAALPGWRFSPGTCAPPTAPRSTNGWPRWPPPSANTIRAASSSAALLPAGPSGATMPPWPASAGAPTAPPPGNIKRRRPW
jgi:hypothetical protein